MSMKSEAAPSGKSETLLQNRSWLAAGGVVGAMLAASCCIGPLVLLSLGVSGAWIGNLTTIEPYKPVFAVIAVLSIGQGFRQVYFRPEAACASGSHCAQPLSAAITKTALWLSTDLVILALTVDWWAPVFY